VDSRGNTLNDSCGYSADTLSQNGETFPGAVVSGDKCISVEADQISGATISVQGEYASKERTFVKFKQIGLDQILFLPPLTKGAKDIQNGKKGTKV
jgi:hypothetical protein